MRNQSCENRLDPKQNTTETIEEETTVDPLQVFADKVTMAGLHEAYSAKYKSDRLMFQAAIVLSFIVIARQSYAIVTQYLTQKAIFDDTVLVNSVAPYPNVSICPHSAGLNGTLLKQWMRYSAQTERLSHWKSPYWNLADKGYIIWYLQRVLDWGMGWKELGDRRYEMMRHAFRDAAAEAATEGRNIYDIFLTPCRETMADCKFHGVRFDCCDYVSAHGLTTHSCYTFDMRRLAQQLGNHRRNTRIDDLALQALQFTIKMDWRIYYEGLAGDADDGYDIYFSQIPSPFMSVTPIPSNMDTFVQLGEPVRIRELADCISDAKVPKTHHYPYYDDLGTHCKHDALLDMQMKYANCMFPVGSNDFSNVTCMFEQIYLISLGMDGGSRTGSTETMVAPDSPNVTQSVKIVEQPSSLASLADEVLKTASLITSKNTPCKPLCSRWTYPVFSTSFTEIRYARESSDPPTCPGLV